MRKQLAAAILGSITIVTCVAVAIAANDTTRWADTVATDPHSFLASAKDDDGGRVNDPDYERAGRAAIEAVGGGKVLDVDRENERGAAWEVEVLREDGTEADVLLDAQFRVIHIGEERDGDRGGSDDGDSGKDDDGGKDDDDGGNDD